MQKRLTAKFVEALKGTGKVQKYSDLISPNLLLIVTKTGTATWVWQGRIDGKLREFRLGRFPIHSLDDARTWADDITENRDKGINLVEKEEADAAAEAVANSRTCDWMFDLYMAAEGGAKKSASEKWRIYRKDISPFIGSKIVDQITHDDLAKLVYEKSQTAPIASNAMQALIARWFRWAVTKGRIPTGLTVNPAVDLVKLADPKSRDRFLDDGEIKMFLKAVVEFPDEKFYEVLRFILYTGVRRSEAFEMPWSELRDLDDGIWVIPGKRTKNGLDHLLPLPHEMITLLKARREKKGDDILVWPSDVTSDNGMTGFSKLLAKLMKRMGELAAEEGREMERWTIHDLRRSLSSGMNRLRDDTGRALIPADVVERVINHKLGGVAGVYNRHDYQEEKRLALRQWADHLATLMPSA